MDNDNKNKFEEFNVEETGFVYGDNGPEVVPADFDKISEMQNNSQGLDFPNNRIEQENRQAELAQLQKKKSFLEKLKDKFKGKKKGGIR